MRFSRCLRRILEQVQAITPELNLRMSAWKLCCRQDISSYPLVRFQAPVLVHVSTYIGAPV